MKPNKGMKQKHFMLKKNEINQWKGKIINILKKRIWNKKAKEQQKHEKIIKKRKWSKKLNY